MLTLAPYQRADLARASTVNGLICAWDKGGGKTLFAYLWPWLKGARRVLIVAPEGLHGQIRDEGRSKFHGGEHPILSHEMAFGIFPEATEGKPLYYLTSYHALAAKNECGRTLAEVLNPHFDCVVVDEGVRLKATDSSIAQAIRQLTPVFRLVLTATPIKNRVEDFFWLAAWAAPDRWPYPMNEIGRRAFLDEFAAVEFDPATERSRILPELCNRIRFARLTARIVLRRRKADFGRAIVSKHFHAHRSPLGKAQALTYRAELDAVKPAHQNARTDAGQKIQNLRLAALCPTTSRRPWGQGDAWTDLTPKLFQLLTLAAKLLQEKQQLVIFSDHLAFSRSLAARLNEAGMIAQRMDGEISAQVRSDRAAAFRRGEFPIAICSFKSMSEGFDFPQCAHLALPGLSWAFDQNDQAIDRVHRLVSIAPAHIHFFITENTIDETLFANFQTKFRSSALALDGSPDFPELEPFALEVPESDEAKLECRWHRDLLPQLLAA